MTHAGKNYGQAFNAEEVLSQRLYSALELAGVRASVGHAEKIAQAIRTLIEAVVAEAQKHSHLAECYACGTEIEVEVAHEDGVETAVTCPACGVVRTFATLRDEESGAWYAEDVTNLPTDAIGYGVPVPANGICPECGDKLMSDLGGVFCGVHGYVAQE